MRTPRIGATSFLLACGVFLSRTMATGHIPDEPVAEPYSALDSPRFEVEFHRGRLRIDGHVLSSEHERRLREMTARLVAIHDAELVLRPFGVLPDHWADATSLLLDALSATESASAVLTADSLRLHGVGIEGWRRRAAMLHTGLPDVLDVSVDMTVADPGVDVAALCARAFSGYRPGRINFEESGTVFRSSAYSVLERIAALADTCRDSTIAVTGHSDSSGDETWNQRLSRARAVAVADYLQQQGINRQRLLVAGAGSSSPIADNATRHGRSLNRRIEIDFRPGMPPGN